MVTFSIAYQYHLLDILLQGSQGAFYLQMVNKWRDVRDSKNLKKVLKVATCSAARILIQCNVQGSVISSDCVSHLFSHCNYQMYTCMNNPFITAREMDFLIIWLIILISVAFLVFPILLQEKQRTKNSGKISEYSYIHPLYHIQISAQFASQLKKWIS